MMSRRLSRYVRETGVYVSTVSFRVRESQSGVHEGAVGAKVLTEGCTWRVVGDDLTVIECACS